MLKTEVNSETLVKEGIQSTMIFKKHGFLKIRITF